VLLFRVALLLVGSLIVFGAYGCSRAVPDDEPAVRWVVTNDGVGPVRLGMPRDELIALGGSVNGDDGPCEFVRPQAAPAGVLAMVVKGRVRRVDITTPNVTTVAGIGVGRTEAEIRRAYPATRVEPHKYHAGRYFTVDLGKMTGEPTRLIFETDGIRVTRYRVGFPPEVEWVEGCS
jgi:hypothetical protein